MPDLSGLQLGAAVVLYLAVAAACLVVGRRLLPERQDRPARWSAAETFAAFFLSYFFCMALVTWALLSTGLGKGWCGPEAVAAMVAEEETPAVTLQRTRFVLRVRLLALPLQVLTVPLLLRLVSNTPPAALGLTAERWRANLALGVLGWLVVSPPVLGLHLLVKTWYERMAPVFEHSFTNLIEQSGRGELALVILAAVVAAPVLEELLFRGLLQTWLASRSWGGHLAMALALAAAFLLGPPWKLLRSDQWSDRLQVLAPPLFVLLTLPAYAWVYLRQKSPGPSAVFGIAILWATVHSNAWPSPVPLFFLGLVLGWLARRTGSLVGPITLHALFNAIAAVQLALS